MNADWNNYKTCIILLFLLLQSRDWVDGGNRTPFAKVTIIIFFFYLFFVRGISREKVETFEVFLNFFMKSHMMIVKTLNHHNYGYSAFWGKMWILNKNNFISQNFVFHTNNSNGYRKQSLKIWASSGHFSRFHRCWKFKIQRNKSEWCKTLLRSIVKVNFNRNGMPIAPYKHV